MNNYIITFNVSNSSLKSAAFAVDGRGAPEFSLDVELQSGKTVSNGAVPRDLLAFPPNQFAELSTEAILHAVQDRGGAVVACVHRVVHGGKHHNAMLLNQDILTELEQYESICPLLQPPAIDIIRHLHNLMPSMPQVAVFDTAFHHSLPRLATEYALPLVLRQDGVRGYGFHGISCEHVLRQLRQEHGWLAGKRLLIAHLGSYASMTAVKDGLSVATTMGFSTLDGLPMATASGHIDPGIILYLLENGWAKSRLTDLLYHQSGLAGLSGSSGDIRALLASDTENARFTVDYFCYRAAREAASLSAAMEGLDAVVFTGGIGVHQPRVRARIVERLGWLGARLDSQANDANKELISASTSAITLLTMPANEEEEMFLQAQAVLAGARPEPPQTRGTNWAQEWQAGNGTSAKGH